MANRRIEMHEYQEALYRMRLGQTDRAIGRDRILGRRKLGELRAVALEQGWLAEESQLPSAAQIAAALACSKGGVAAGVGLVRHSSVEPFAERIRQWFEQGGQGTTIYAALVREHGFTGHYSFVRRFLGIALRKVQSSVPDSLQSANWRRHTFQTCVRYSVRHQNHLFSPTPQCRTVPEKVRRF